MTVIRDRNLHKDREDRKDDITHKVKLEAPAFDGVYNPQFSSTG